MASYRGTDFSTFMERFGEFGYVDSVAHPIVHVRGLPSVFSREVVLFDTGQIGQVISLSADYVDVLLFSNDFVGVDSKVVRTNALLQMPVGLHMLGQVIDALGNSVYAASTLSSSVEYRPVDIRAAGIMARSQIKQPFETGVTMVDLMIPLGMGQRELVIGDRKTGKTDFLLQTVLHQAKQGVICIYAAIGKRIAAIKEVEKFFSANNITRNTVLMVSSSLDPVGLINLTPFSAMTLAEYFRDMGHEVLLILDDLTEHAKFYRETSLLGGRFPGRSSYPGDIFYTHSRLLERAGCFKTSKGVHSITCLPVVITTEGDISGYIQTNLMSITDGHIYFDMDLFSQGRRPAINSFLSVTRVGRQTQSPLKWSVNRELNALLTLVDKTQSFVHFGAELSEGVRTTLATGQKVIDFFNQPVHVVVPVNLQIILFGLIWLGLLKGVEDAVNMQYVIGEAAKTYATDASFKSLVDGLIVNASDFNALLGKLTANSKNLLGFMKLPV